MLVHCDIKLISAIKVLDFSVTVLSLQLAHVEQKVPFQIPFKFNTKGVNFISSLLMANKFDLIG